jgi:hypothetical protein
VTARRLAGWTAVVAALLLAGFLALLAADVLRWRGHLEETDLRAGNAPGDTRMWIAETRVPRDPAAKLLEIEDEVAFRRALRAFRLANPRRPARNQSDLNRRFDAEAQLAAVGAGDSARSVRSRAVMLRGILALEAARGDPLRAETELRRSLADLRAAIELDDGNADAKYNLELVMRLLRSVEDQSPGTPGQERGGPEGQEAGSARTGSGF